MLSKAMHKMFHVIKRSSDFFFSDEDDVYNSDISVNDSSSEDASDIPDSVSEEIKTYKLQNKPNLDLLKLQHVGPRTSTADGRDTAQNHKSVTKQLLSKEKPRQFEKNQSRTNLERAFCNQKTDKNDVDTCKLYNVVEGNSDTVNNVDDNSFDSSEGRLVIDEKDFEDTENSVVVNGVGLKKVDGEEEKEDDDVSHCSFHTSPVQVIDLCKTFPAVNINGNKFKANDDMNLGEKKDVQALNDGDVLNASANKDKRLVSDMKGGGAEKNEPKNKRKKVESKQNNLPESKDISNSENLKKSSVPKTNSDGEKGFENKNNSSSVSGCSNKAGKRASITKKLFLMKTKDIIGLVEREDHPLHEFADTITEENIEKLSKKERKMFLHILAKLIDESMFEKNAKKFLTN